MTWNIENIKPNQYFLSDLLLSQQPDIVHISEPQTYQSDIALCMNNVKHEYCYWLNSDDIYDPDLPLEKSKAVGGTLAMWRTWLDPYLHVHPVQTSAFLPIVLQLPGAVTSVHIVIYLPTSGKEYEFISELANLKNCLEELEDLYDSPVFFIRGDGNANPKNKSRFEAFSRLLSEFSFKQLKLDHPTYHHFVGEGKFDSNIDVILHSDRNFVTERLQHIVCKFKQPLFSSQHDIIVTSFTLPRQTEKPKPCDLVTAPRTLIERCKILWDQNGIETYKKLVSHQLHQVRESWEDPSSVSLTSIFLQATNHVLTFAAATTNQSFSLTEKRLTKPAKIPTNIKAAKRKLQRKFRHHTHSPSPSSIRQLEAARKAYRQAVRSARLKQAVSRDQQLDTILTNNPSRLYSSLRNTKKSKTSSIEKLKVGDKVYEGSQVGDGFYESMSSLKTCDLEALSQDPQLSEHFYNYENILKICQDKQNIPPVSNSKAADLLKRMKKNVTDIYGITAQHYNYAGQCGIDHLASQLNSILADVRNGTIKELNIALGLIYYKGHQKDKNSDRSYRTISTCPFAAKVLDLYMRDLYQDKWDTCTAPTQYQAPGSCHELASIMITEVVQYSLHIRDLPVYLLILDAQSAFDRCLKEILCTELFKSGMDGSALLLINNRLQNRTTVYQWDGEMLGPAKDMTGVEQGGINSGDYYKLYNNSQLKTAQSSSLGVDINSSIVSAVGQADDVILAANTVDNLMLLGNLTESYCNSYRVKLVNSKTKLLPMYLPRHEYLVRYAKIVNPVTINEAPVEFVNEAEHVGVLRSTAGNMPHILGRISAHKKVLAALSSSGCGRAHRGNPAASLKVHLLYATPVLLSGVATLVLSKPEVKILATHYKCTVQRLQRLHAKTPRAVVLLLGGCLPLEALLHSRQLRLFFMICHLPGDPLYSHAIYILSSAPRKAKSWFQNIKEICALYDLPDPLQMLQTPGPKEAFKKLVKTKILDFWEGLLRTETSGMKSLKYFKPDLYSLTRPHYIWLTSASNPFECSKSTVLARMLSGRFRTETLCKYWSSNKMGFCRAPTCRETSGTLEHLLVTCPALDSTRERLYNMWLQKSVMFPSLHSTIREILDCDESTKTQFILEPLAFPQIANDFLNHGQRFIEQLSYLTRTFAFYIDREYRKIILTSPTQHQPLSLTKTNAYSVSAASPVQPSTHSTISTQLVQRDNLPEVTWSVPATTAKHDQPHQYLPDLPSVHPGHHVPVFSGSTCSVYSSVQLSRQAPSYDRVTQTNCSLSLPSKPYLESPSQVFPADAALAGTVNSNHRNQCFPLLSPPVNVASVSSVPGVNVDSVQPVPDLSDTQYQYQDCTVGFCGGWGSQDHTIQVSSQSHI